MAGDGLGWNEDIYTNNELSCHDLAAIDKRTMEIGGEIYEQTDKATHLQSSIVHPES